MRHIPITSLKAVLSTELIPSRLPAAPPSERNLAQKCTIQRSGGNSRLCRSVHVESFAGNAFDLVSMDETPTSYPGRGYVAPGDVGAGIRRTQFGRVKADPPRQPATAWKRQHLPCACEADSSHP
jgi:hypothetical protein